MASQGGRLDLPLCEQIHRVLQVLRGASVPELVPSHCGCAGI